MTFSAKMPARAFWGLARAFFLSPDIFRPATVSSSAALHDFRQTAISLSSELRLGRVRYPREGISTMKSMVVLDQHLDTFSVGRLAFEQTHSSDLVRGRAEFGVLLSRHPGLPSGPPLRVLILL